jgi:hypothetical protein
MPSAVKRDGGITTRTTATEQQRSLWQVAPGRGVVAS